MTRLNTIAISVLMIAPTLCFANDVPDGHSTVHVVFISPHSQQVMGGLIGEGKSMARVGDVIVPSATIRPIAITIDGDFVGHALVGNWDIKPVFVLPEGAHKFTFTLDGSDPVAAEIKVLGTGSKQYLIVKLPADSDPAKSDKAAGDASTVQPLHN